MAQGRFIDTFAPPSLLAFRPLRPADAPACVALLRAEGARGALLDAALLVRLLAERRIVARAFDDAAIATALSVSLHTVHKRWQAIYARAAEALPEVLGATAAGHDMAGVRGVEKRKLLVEFARAHPQELRPWA